MKVKRYFYAQEGSIQAFTTDEIHKMQEYLLAPGRPYRDYALFEIGLNTGFFLIELVELKFSHFIDKDFHKRDFITYQTESHPFTPVYLNDRLFQIVMTLYHEKPTNTLDSFIFVARGNRKAIHLDPTSATMIMIETMKGSGVRHTRAFAAMRKSFLEQYWGITFLSDSKIRERYNRMFL